MANLEDFDLMSLGKHCHESTCKRLDFLPFKCNLCQEHHCLEHREPRHHLCMTVANNNCQILECPLCQQYVLKGKDMQEDNVQMEKHIMSGCQELIMKKRRKHRCSSNSCRNVNLIPLECSACYQTFCVRHRHANDHNCVQQENFLKFDVHKKRMRAASNQDANDFIYIFISTSKLQAQLKKATRYCSPRLMFNRNEF